jgi:hypothetical protein
MKAIEAPRIKQGSKGGTTAPDRNLKRLRHIFNSAIRHGIVESSPFRKAHLNVISFEKEDGRTRRVEGGEEQRLLAAARKHSAERGQVPWLEHLIVAALDTGCRRGELLTLVSRPRRCDPATVDLRGRRAEP